jgi:hypothetical protein
VLHAGLARAQRQLQAQQLQADHLQRGASAEVGLQAPVVGLQAPVVGLVTPLVGLVTPLVKGLVKEIVNGPRVLPPGLFLF